MKPPVTPGALAAHAALSLVLVCSLSACSGGDGPATATDPAAPGTSAESPRPPHAPPVAPGTVRSTGLPTVMDTGDGPELCLGAIAESYPPQCGGPAIAGWDWSEHQGFDRQGRIRWGTFAVTGTWDGAVFTVDDAIPGALYDPMALESVALPEPSVAYSAEQLQGLSEALADELPGYQGSYPDDEGHVLVDVIYDDGSLQAYADESYGAGVVVLRAALVDVA